MRVSSVSKPQRTIVKPSSAVIDLAKTDEDALREFSKKNPNQFMSICPEHNGMKNIGLKNYAKGGLGCVSYEAPKSWIEHENADVRSFLPYHAPNNPQGKIIVARLLPENDGSINETINPKKTVIKYVDPNTYKLKKNEHFILLNPSVEKDGTQKIALLKDTGIHGSIKGLKEGSLKKENIPYRLFKIANKNSETPDIKYIVHTYQVAAMKESYGVDGAYVTGQKIGKWWDLYYANFNRAVVDAMPQLAEKEGFNPANIWMHDRQGFIAQLDIARRSADGDKFYNGLKLHATLHNPGHSYQGYYEDKLGFLKIVFDEKDFSKLKNLPDFNELKILTKKTAEELTENDKKRLSAIFDKYFANLMDNWDINGNLTDKSLPNITMSTVASRRLNPLNSTLGTVSQNYGVEMRTLTDVAGGMTYALKLTPTIDITNGCTPASMKLDQITDFGLGNNGISRVSYEFTPYTVIRDKNNKIINFLEPPGKEKITPETISDLKAKIKEIFENNIKLKAEKKALDDAGKKAEALVKKNEITALTKQLKEQSKLLASKISIKQARELNKEWILGLISDCIVTNDAGKIDDKATEEALKKLFYNEEQIKDKGLRVHGFLSKFSKGDRIFSNWGRSDEQKGFPTMLQGFYKYLKNKSIPESEKLNTKILFGSAGKWKDTDPDYLVIKEYLNKIGKLDGGKYKGNVCYIEGFFPNRLIACGDFGLFSSRFEPCGLTPAEAAAAGAPSASIRTGGAPNLIKEIKYKIENGKSIPVNLDEASGLLTKDPYLLDEKDVFKALKGRLKKGECTLDEARRELISDQFVDFFDKVMKLDETQYDKLSLNCLYEEMDWHNNQALNAVNGKKGRCANEIYMSDVFGLRRHRVTDKKSKLFGTFVIDGYSANSRSLKRMKKLTGSLGDASNIPVELTDNSINANRRAFTQKISEAGEQTTSLLKRIFSDKRTYIIATAAAAVAGIAFYALNRGKSEKINKKNIGNSVIYF